MSKDYPWGKGTPVWVRDATPNDSDKVIYTVPNGKCAQLQSLYVRLVASATVGNRSLAVQVLNAAAQSVYELYYGIIAAGVTGNYTIFPGAPSDTTAPTFSGPIPAMILLAGYSVRVWDIGAIDPAADDLTTALCYVEYDA